MFENLVSQSASKILVSDISTGKLPGSLLFAGNSASGKLTAALEISRILSCHQEDPKKSFACMCPSCVRQKSLLSTNLVLCGPRDCFLEINAACDSFLRSVSSSDGHIEATRFLFLRAVRKLTLRFSEVLIEGHKDENKIGNAVGALNEMLEELDFPRPLPAFEEFQKKCEKIKEAAQKLESDFLPDSIPISYIRNIEYWARLKNDEGRKTVIIENADCMLDNARNALLKILEEPPKDVVFILLTTRRNAIIPTILSRVRIYNFADRNREIEKQVVSRVFHKENFEGGLNDYLLGFLPVTPDNVKKYSEYFLKSASQGAVPDIAKIIKDCNKFEPRVLFKIFLQGINEKASKLKYTQSGAEVLAELTKLTLSTWTNVTVYAQGIQGALENLFREILKLNITNGNIFKCADL